MCATSPYAHSAVHCLSQLINHQHSIHITELHTTATQTVLPQAFIIAFIYFAPMDNISSVMTGDCGCSSSSIKQKMTNDDNSNTNKCLKLNNDMTELSSHHIKAATAVHFICVIYTKIEFCQDESTTAITNQNSYKNRVNPANSHGPPIFTIKPNTDLIIHG